jgi:hypothetical protein
MSKAVKPNQAGEIPNESLRKPESPRRFPDVLEAKNSLVFGTLLILLLHRPSTKSV